MQVIINDSTASDLSAEKIVEKQLSLYDKTELVTDEFEKEHGFYSPFFVSSVLDSFIVIRDTEKKEFLKATYSINSADESVTIQDQSGWTLVRLQKEWIEKSFYVRSHKFDIGEFIIKEEDESIPVGSPIKEISENRLGFYGYLWGSAEKKDLHREYFSKDTDGLTELFDQLGAIPFTYAHARDKKAKATVFGMVDEMKEDEVGMWVEVQITNHKKYRQMLQPIIEEEALYPSSETLVGAKKVAKDGHIERWVTSFMTGTTSPAEWRMIDHPMEEIKSLYKSIGVDEEDFDSAVGIDANSDKEASDVGDNAETQKEEVTNQGAAEARLKALIDIEFQKLQLLQLKL